MSETILSGTVEDTHLTIQADQVTITRSNSDSYEQVAEYTEKRDDSIIAQAGNDNANRWAQLDATATWLEPSADALPYQAMSTSATLAWRQIEDLEQKMLASYGPHLRRRNSTDMSTERFSRRWAMYLTERGVPAFDAVADGLIAVIDREEMDERVPTKFRFPKYKDGAWDGSLIIPRRSAFAKEGRQVITGCQVKPGRPDLAVNSEGKPMKVVSPMGEQFNDASIPRRSLWLIEQAGGVNLHRDIVLVLTEGYAEAAGIAGAGVPAFSAAGVNAYFNSGRNADDEIIKDEDGRTAVRVLVPSLRRYIRTWKANGCLRRVQFIVLYDSDAGQKEQVQKAGAETVWAIRREGGRAEFYYAPLQYDETGQLIKGAGAGDYLAKGRTWSNLWEKCTHVPMGKSMVKPKVNAAVVKTADEVNWFDIEDVYEFAMAHRRDGDSFPWERVGGRDVWSMTSVSPLRMAKWWASTMGTNYMLTEDGNLLYRYNGTVWQREDTSKGLIRAANDFLKIAGALADCALGPTETESQETVRGSDGKPQLDEFGNEKTVTLTHTAWPSEFLGAYEEGSKHRYLVSFMKAEPSLSVPDNNLNKRGDILVCQNGTYDHSTGEFRENRPEDLTTMHAECEYDQNARHEVWEAVLESWGGRGSELERYMNLIMAESLLRRLPTDYKLKIIKGRRHAAKSFGIIVMKKCFPHLVKKLPKQILSGDINANSTQFAIAKLSDGALFYAEETERDHAIIANTIKELHSKSDADARRPGQEFYEATAAWAMFLLVNNEPTIVGKIDESVAQRFQLINLPYQYVDNPTETWHRKQDRTIEQRVDRELDAIRAAAFAWVIEGLRRLRDEYGDNLDGDVATPQFIKDDTAKYLSGSDWVARFVEDRLEFGQWKRDDPDNKRFQMTASDIMHQYRVWRKEEYGDNDKGSISRRTVLDRLEDHPLLVKEGVVPNARPRQRDKTQPTVWTGLRPKYPVHKF